jgi:putative transposase
LKNGFDAATQFYKFPKDHHRRIHTTNALERLNGELKRRSRAVGQFPDRQSALRLLGTIAIQVTAKWAERRYLDITLMGREEDKQKAA